MEKLEKRIPLATPTMHGGEMEYIQEAFDTNWIAPLGKNVDEFENDLKNYMNIKAATALSAGTAALHLAMKLAGVKTGDRVFCSDMTFSATVNPVTYENGCPVFIDSERETWNMDPKALEKAFSKYPDTKVVVVADLYGIPAKWDEIVQICEKYNAIIIEDAAEALSANYKGKKVGTFGKYNVISFNGNKIITTSGGGMILSDDADAMAKAKFWATQSREPAPWYQHNEIGYNYRMSNIVAGIGRGQIKYIEEHKRIKTEIYKRYCEAFADMPVSMNPYEACADPNFWLSCMLIDEGCKVKPMDIFEHLNSLNIETRPIWKPMHMQPVFSDCDFISAEDKPVNEDIFNRGLCLPSDVKMTEDEQKLVIKAIKELF